MSNVSKKHHFVPVFYLKGFFSERNNEVYVYEKKYGILKSRHPKQILYEENLHTISVRNERFLMIEEFYSMIEGQFKKYIEFIEVNNKSHGNLSGLMKDPDFVKVTKVLVAIQFWRTPCKKELAVEYLSKILELYDKSSGQIKELMGGDRKFLKYISKRRDKYDSVKIAQFYLLPLLTFEIINSGSDVKLLKSTPGKFFFTSDRPVVFDGFEKLFSFESFLFPLTKDLLLVGGKVDLKVLSVEKVNKLVINRANKIVISGSKAQLAMLKTNKNSREGVILNKFCVPGIIA